MLYSSPSWPDLLTLFYAHLAYRTLGVAPKLPPTPYPYRQRPKTRIPAREPHTARAPRQGYDRHDSGVIFPSESPDGYDD